MATDLQGQTATSTLSVQVALTTYVTAPIGSGHISRPQITWASNAAASGYDLWVNQIGGVNSIINLGGLTETSFTPAEDLPNGNYRVWVRARNEAGPGPWSTAHEFTVGLTAVTITSPDRGLVNSKRPVIEWTASDRATEYDLWVNQVGGQSQIIRETAVSANTFTPNSDLEDGVYRLWVKAKNSLGESAWSSGLTFEINTQSVPTITAPTSSVSIARPQIVWTGSPDSTYEVWVNQLGGTSKIVHDISVTGTSLTPASNLPSGNYRVWVRLRAATGSAGPWSSAYNFTISLNDTPARVLASGVSVTDARRPVFTWAAATNAASYEIWVNDVTTTATRVIRDNSITELEYTAVVDLPAGNYRVWLRAFNSGGIASAWSEAVDFVLT